MLYRKTVASVIKSNTLSDANWNKTSGQIIWEKIVVFLHTLLFKSHILLAHRICVENVRIVLKIGIGICSNWTISCVCDIFRHMRYKFMQNIVYNVEFDWHTSNFQHKVHLFNAHLTIQQNVIFEHQSI